MAKVVRKMGGRLTIKDLDSQQTLIERMIDALRATLGVDAGTKEFLEANKSIAKLIDDVAISAAVSLFSQQSKQATEFTIVSIGSGDCRLEIAIENALSTILSKEELNAMKWILVDPIYAFARPKCFGSASGRWACVDKKIDNFYSIGEVHKYVGMRFAPENCVVLSFLSLHHIDLSGTEIIKRYFKGNRYLMIEEPVAEVAWHSFEYRIVRTVLELLANVAYQPTWARRFVKNPTELFFKPLYTSEIDEACGDLKWLPGTAPPLIVATHANSVT